MKDEIKNIPVWIIYSDNYTGGYYFRKDKDRKHFLRILRRETDLWYEASYFERSEIKIIHGVVSQEFLNFCKS